MKMSESSRVMDKKPLVNNNLDLIIGAGIANQSVSIDGLSQSVGTTQSAMFGGASARIQNYSDDLEKRIMPLLRARLSGIKMVVV